MEDLATFVTLCRQDGYTAKELPFCYFTRWIRAQYRNVDRVNLVKDGEDILVNGYEGAKLMFTFRHVPVPE